MENKSSGTCRSLLGIPVGRQSLGQAADEAAELAGEEQAAFLEAFEGEGEWFGDLQRINRALDSRKSWLRGSAKVIIPGFSQSQRRADAGESSEQMFRSQSRQVTIPRTSSSLAIFSASVAGRESVEPCPKFSDVPFLIQT